MLKRTYYALCMAWRYRQAIKNYCQDKAKQCKSVLELDPATLQQQGFKAVILDFDGVLASHGEDKVTPEIASWLDSFSQRWDANRVFVLSNKPEVERVQYFIEHFKRVNFVRPLRKKPYPDTILQILQWTQIAPKELLVVDDRLLTGVLAAVIANTEARYVTNPLISFEKRPLTESFFMGLRALEKFAFTLSFRSDR